MLSFSIEPSWLWLAALVAFIILEAATAQIVAIWFMAGCVAAFIASLFGVGAAWEIGIFVVVSGLALVFLRPLFKKKMEGQRVATNADMVIGKVGVVLEDIDNDMGTGRVRALNLDWSARAYYKQRIKKGTKVNVCSIDGVKLIVIPLKELEDK